MIFKSNGSASIVNQRDAIPRALGRIIPIITEAEHSGKHGQVMNGFEDTTPILGSRVLPHISVLQCHMSELARRLTNR
jgi:hypothetical protein